jgi:hypothetical protein
LNSAFANIGWIKKKTINSGYPPRFFSERAASYHQLVVVLPLLWVLFTTKSRFCKNSFGFFQHYAINAVAGAAAQWL